jgi:transposase
MARRQRKPHQPTKDFIRFNNAVGRAVPAGKVIHVILDDYPAHRHAKLRRWLTRHPHLTLASPTPHAPG